MAFNYEKFVVYLISKEKRREAWFIQKYYLERKNRKNIIAEMYMNSKGYYYNLKKRCKDLIEKNYSLHQFLDKN